VGGADAIEATIEMGFDGGKRKVHRGCDFGELQLLDEAEEEDSALARRELLDRLPDLREGLVGDEVLFGRAAGLGEMVGEVAGVYGSVCGALPEAEGLGAGVRAQKVEGDAGDPGGDAAVATEGAARAPDVEEGVLRKGESEVAITGGEQQEAEDARLVERVETGDIVEGRSCNRALREHVQVSGLEGLLQHGVSNRTDAVG